MTFRSLGDLLPGVLARAERLAAFQEALNAMPTPGAQKAAIMEAHCHGLLDHDDTAMLVDVYQLACA